MSTAVATWGGLVTVICVVTTLILQVRKQTSEQKAAEREAAAKLRRETLREGYHRRNDEVKALIDRVVDQLNSVIGTSPMVDRQINRTISILTDGRDGSSDADTE